MKTLGFTEYECKAYIALLEENPATAYEIARRSGIPTSKIYETIAKLLEKETVLEIAETGKKRYIPVDPTEMISKFSGKINSTLASLKTELNSLTVKQKVSYIFNINSYELLMKKAKSIIEVAEKTLLISAWNNELEIIKQDINCKKIKTAVVNFGKMVPEMSAIVYQHPVGHTLSSEKGGRQFVIIADSSEALSGTIYNDGSADAAWSRNEGYVSLADDFIRHDIYILKVVKRFNELLITTYGKNFEKMRNIFEDEVLK